VAGVPIAAGGAWVTAVAGVKAFGFTSAGIAAKSTAAAAMSKAAIAGGGKIAAGSTISWLQSVGATATVSNPITIMVAGGSFFGGKFLYNHYKKKK
jgi:hypothetical protein